MTDRDFCYWLQGYFELTNSNSLSPGQVHMIKEHLALVFDKVTPYSSPKFLSGTSGVSGTSGAFRGTCGTSGNGNPII